ncbi:MAG: class I SAM-dependent methyltransferase [Acidobacteriota bacterium]|nr:MAG: class I SAM-dependent methyltransferase [Acidobacteriota bacterium]
MTDAAFERMDSMYRYQRYFYDATRRFYLLGRDTLLDRMFVRPGDNVLEIGCGTGRNLRILASRHPQATLYGIDASSEMLLTASAKIEKDGVTNIRLETALAESFDRSELFALDERFDSAFFSYSISMIPPWRHALEHAAEQIKPGGSLYIVDFYDQERLPRWFQTMIKGWLRHFHVQFWSDLLPFLDEFAKSKGAALTIEPLYRRYSFFAELRFPQSEQS